MPREHPEAAPTINCAEGDGQPCWQCLDDALDGIHHSAFHLIEAQPDIKGGMAAITNSLIMACAERPDWAKGWAEVVRAEYAARLRAHDLAIAEGDPVGVVDMAAHEARGGNAPAVEDGRRMIASNPAPRIAVAPESRQQRRDRERREGKA